jgi:hypothetical protein
MGFVGLQWVGTLIEDHLRSFRSNRFGGDTGRRSAPLERGARPRPAATMRLDQESGLARVDH